MPDESLRLEWRTPAELAENPRNWRLHSDAQMSALADVLADVGWAGACLYNEATGRLIDGHARRKLALDQGSAHVPVLIGSWTEAQEKTILATLDPLAGMAEADTERLTALLAEVKPESEAVQAMLADLAETNGVADDTPTSAEDAGPEVDRAAELQAKWGTERGQLWQIGRHRLLCGDATDAADVGRLMGGEKAGLCFTSPPYDQQRSYEGNVGDWLTLMKGVFANLPMSDDGQVLVNLGLIHRDGEWQPYWDPWIEWMRAQGWRRFGWYVWDQLAGFPGVFGGRCAPAHEFIFHFNKATTTAQKCVATKSEGRTKHGGRMREHGWEEDPRRVITTGALKIPDSVWRLGRVGDADLEHPAIFPVALPQMAMKTWEGDLVYEPFGGSGTTMVAAEQLGRRCFGIEIEPKYVAVALERLAALGLDPRRAAP